VTANGCASLFKFFRRKSNVFSELKARWLKKTGEPMPEAIMRLPLKKICKAVLLVEAGVTVVVPKETTPVISDSGDSMAEWDSHKEY
jgi:hypothetical protein